MICGLLGRTLGHSYSPQIHQDLGDYSYSLYEKAPDELENFLKNADYSGLNVTIPYKKAVIPYCASLSDSAKRIGSVNTIVRQANGSLIGHNTDYYGFMSMVRRSGIDVQGIKVLVLGSGGAAVTVNLVLQELGAIPVVISRTGPNNYNNLEKHRDAALIVNTTPVGMYPDCGCAPVDVKIFPNLKGVLDLVYNPARTKLLMDAQEQGLITENGLWMLVAQAKESAEWFTGRSIADEQISCIYNKLRKQMENIVLIGMPGSGKTTVGRLLAEKLGRRFIDADEEICKAAGKTIPEIFAESGETGFRTLETAVLGELGKASGLVIATGGGCVTRPENYSLLHQNGQIIWLQRNIKSLPVTGRPLSQSGNLYDMYLTREPLYRSFADWIVENNCDPKETVQKILSLEDTL